MDTKSQIPNNPTPSKLNSQVVHSCDKLILELFIQITLDGDHSRLGEGDTESAWQAIQAEYETLTGGVGYSSTVAIMRQINYLSASISVIIETVGIMRRYYLPTFGEILAKYGVRFNWTEVTNDVYYTQLTSVLATVKLWKVQLAAKQKEWETLVAKGDKSGVTREYYEEWLIGLSKSQGYHLNPNKITVYTFATLIKQALKPKSP
jgi:hypothetical protein